MGTDDPAALRIMLLTDVFPPGSGGSGWSTYYLAKALAERGHEVQVVQPGYGRQDSGYRVRRGRFKGVAVDEVLVPQAPRWAEMSRIGKVRRERMASWLISRYAYHAAERFNIQVLHAQHSVSTDGAALAARRLRKTGREAALISTIRDYWPLCPVSTRLFEDREGSTFECSDCHQLRTYLRCYGRQAKLPTATAASLARWLLCMAKSRALASCDGVIAVSNYVREELERSGRVNAEKLWTIPNLVDLLSVDRALQRPWPLTDLAPEEPFLLFVGKLDVNKGAQLLPEAVARSDAGMPVVITGSGPLMDRIEREAKSRGLDFRFYNWLDNDDVVMLMNRASVLMFPSAWQEPLSRVLLEGLASGAAVVVMDTGGTKDAISHYESGWLSETPQEFAEGIRLVAGDPLLNARLRTGARQTAEMRFAAPIVAADVEDLYRELLARKGREAA
jgi:glycogen(starch) synthase